MSEKYLKDKKLKIKKKKKKKKEELERQLGCEEIIIKC